MPTTDLPRLAARYAAAGWEIFPLRGKVPLFPSAHPEGDPLRGICKGECGRDGHGVLDATSSPETIRRWWTAHPASNIGIRPPDGVTVLDVDPRHDGGQTMTKLVQAHGKLPATQTTISGRGDGGRHYWFRTPLGAPLVVTELRRQFGPGVDIKGHGGYLVAPGSIHPDTGRPYEHGRGAQKAVRMPDWLLTLLAPPVAPPAPSNVRPITLRTGPSPADAYTEATTWTQVLAPHGWRCVGGDGDSDSSKWKHPTATSACSATVRHDQLFVYSPNAGLPITEPSAPRGLTRFRVYAHLEHHGDLSAAARAVRGYVKAAA